MITSNVFCRVFFIKVGATTGTAFTIEDADRQYLVTAAHVVAGLTPPFSVELFHENQWKILELELTGICPVSDIAVFAPRFQLSPAFPLPASADGVMFGQDVYFLGFPYGITSDAASLNQGRPFPLVKKACLSAVTQSDKGAKIVLLDGHNNPGFSGGPVVFCERGKPLASSFKVLGVVSGYRFAEEPAYHGGAPTPVTVRANTGIVICYNITHAIDVIRKNPNGALIPKA
jgi:S1-C subfamily serine protease